MTRRNGIPLSFIVLCLLPQLAAAQQLVEGDKHVSIARMATQPTIDGKIDPGEWTGATEVSDLHQVIPVEFSTPTERTNWYLSYNDTAILIAAHAFDADPGHISASTLHQGGDIDSDDSLHILIDSFNNKRSGYTFALNPNSVRYDAIFLDGTRESGDWEGIWHGRATRTEDGWSMEMSIPFTTLNFDPDNPTWGINLWREIPRRAEMIAWRSYNSRVDPTASGEITGLTNLSQGKGLDLIPSVSSSYLNDRIIDETTSDLNPSLDISYKLTNSINALVTFNTDFAATEVDGRQLGLQRFSLFFPEKRSFFLTDFDIFQFGGIPADGNSFAAPVGVQSGNNGLAFFSRRIGLSATAEPVDINFGTKLSGRLGNIDVGTLYIRQDEFADIDASDLLVARVVRPLFEESTMGAIATYGDPQSNNDSSLLGFDFLYRNTRLKNNRSLENQWWVQKSNNAGVSDKDLAYNVSLALPTRIGLSAGAQYHVVEANYRPALGFANRTGVRLYATELAYLHTRTNPRVIRDYEAELKFSRWEYLDTGRVQSQKIELIPLKLRSVAGDFFRIGVSLQKEGLLPGEQPLERIGIFIPPGEYAFNRVRTYMRSAGHRKFAFELFIEDGDYFNGKRTDISPAITWRPNEHFGMTLDYANRTFKFPGATEITREVSLDADIAFNSRLSLTTLVQYDNVSDDIGINLRLRFNVEAGRDIWLVLDHNMFDDPVEDRFISTQSSAAVKIRYTFRY